MCLPVCAHQKAELRKTGCPKPPLELKRKTQVPTYIPALNGNTRWVPGRREDSVWFLLHLHSPEHGPHPTSVSSHPASTPLGSWSLLGIRGIVSLMSLAVLWPRRLGFSLPCVFSVLSA